MGTPLYGPTISAHGFIIFPCHNPAPVCKSVIGHAALALAVAVHGEIEVGKPFKPNQVLLHCKCKLRCLTTVPL